MTLEGRTSHETMNFAQSKNALRDNPEPDILTLAIDTQPCNRTRDSLLDELMALKAMRDKGNQRGDSVCVKAVAVSVGNSQLCRDNIDDAALHAKKHPDQP